MNVETTRDSYRHCRRIARRASSSFYWTFRLLPREQRRAMCALYAFSRHTDDLADSPRPVAERKRQLEAWRERVRDVLRTPVALDIPPGDLSDRAARRGEGILPALVDAARRYTIPREYLLDIVEGVMMDLDPREFADLDELRGYCYRVASCVGLACVHIWGYRDVAVREPAIACGIAFQLTNILRDLREDASRGRLYLPVDELRRFGVTREDLRRGDFHERLRGLMQFELERTERFYCEAEVTREFLLPAGQRMFGMMFATYRELLQEIRRRGGDVFSRRVRLPWRRKVAIAVRHAWLWPAPNGSRARSPQVVRR